MQVRTKPELLGNIVELASKCEDIALLALVENLLKQDEKE